MPGEIIYTEHRRRLTGKISADASREEIQSLLATWHGIPYEQVDTHEVENAYNELQKESQNQAEVRAIIEPFYSDLKGKSGANDAKKLSELITIGRFVREINWPIQILECSERPDFIVKYEERRVGIELTQLFDEEVVREIADLKSVIRIVEDRLRDHNPNVGILNLYLDTEKVQNHGKHFKQFRKQDRLDLAHAIHSCVCSFLAGTRSFPDFIKEITHTPGYPTSLSLGEMYWLKNIDVETLIKRVEKKSQDISNYRKIHDLSEVWLIIAIDGASSSSSFNYSPEMLPDSINTGFRQVFIYNLFDQKILRGENTNL